MNGPYVHICRDRTFTRLLIHIYNCCYNFCNPTPTKRSKTTFLTLLLCFMNAQCRVRQMGVSPQCVHRWDTVHSLCTFQLSSPVKVAPLTNFVMWFCLYVVVIFFKHFEQVKVSKNLFHCELKLHLFTNILVCWDNFYGNKTFYLLCLFIAWGHIPCDLGTFVMNRSQFKIKCLQILKQ